MSEALLTRLFAAAAEAERLDEVHGLVASLLDRDVALEVQREFTAHLENGASPDDDAGLVRLSDVEPSKVRWLWPGRIPLGKLTLIDGDPGLGKSTLALDLAARLSRAAEMPDGSHPDVEGARGTVLLTAEDGLGDTVRPRLDAAEADCNRVGVLTSVPAEGETEGSHPPTVGHLRELRKAICQFNASLLVVDPLSAHLGDGVNTHKDKDVRAALVGLANLADEMDVAVVAIRHLNKSGGTNPLYRGGGSIGLIGAARAGFLVAADPDDPNEKSVLAPTKMNLAPTPPALRYGLEAEDGAVRTVWLGESSHSAVDLLKRPSSGEPTARDEAAGFLAEQLTGGPRPVTELRDAAEDLGLAWRTVQRAKQEMAVEARRVGGIGEDGHWEWHTAGDPNGASPKGSAAFGDNNRGNPHDDRETPKTDNEDSKLAPLGGAHSREPNECSGCGRTLGPTAEICGRCRRNGVGI